MCEEFHGLVQELNSTSGLQGATRHYTEDVPSVAAKWRLQRRIMARLNS
jgi:hypothetical protein